jgi:hypothetical protein
MESIANRHGKKNNGPRKNGPKNNGPKNNGPKNKSKTMVSPVTMVPEMEEKKPKASSSKKVKAYRIVDFPNPGDKFGRYQGKEPAKAAKKAFTKLARLSKLNNSNKKFIVFVIEEIGGDKKQFKYMGQRVKLDKPRIVKIGDKEITYKYQNIVNVYDGSA